jgi:hypothetical protein
VFLADNDIDRAVNYVEKNPLKEKKSAQHWNFVRREEVCH